MDEDIKYDEAPYIAVCPSEAGYGGYYGKGYTVEEAKANLKGAGGSLTRYLVYRLPEGATAGYVDDWGGFCWTWKDDAPDKNAVGETVFQRGMK
jgi:hypothetical protein